MTTPEPTSRPVTVGDLVRSPKAVTTVVRKIATQIPISSLLLGPPPPETPEQRAERQARTLRLAEETTAAAAALAAVDDPLARAVLDLHRSDGGTYLSSCEGCDYAGFDGEPPTFPCRTVELVAERLGIALPATWTVLPA